MKKVLALLFAAAALVGCNQESSQTETGTRSSRPSLNEGAGAPNTNAPSTNTPGTNTPNQSQQQQTTP